MNELSATAQRRSYTRTTNARIPEHVRAHTWPQRYSNLAMTRRHRTTFTHANSQLSVEKWPGEQRTHARTQQRAAPPPCCNCPICTTSAHPWIYSQSTRTAHHKGATCKRLPTCNTAASLHWRGPENPMKRSNVHTARAVASQSPRSGGRPEARTHHMRTGGTPLRSNVHARTRTHAHAATPPPGHQKWHF